MVVFIQLILIVRGEWRNEGTYTYTYLSLTVILRRNVVQENNIDIVVQDPDDFRESIPCRTLNNESRREVPEGKRDASPENLIYFF